MIVTDAWLGHMVGVTRGRMLRDWDVSSCIAATRIAIDVLTYFAVPAVPCPVRFAAYTADAWEQRLADPAAALTSGHSIGIAGTGAVFRSAGRSHWDGHLAVELPIHRRLLDLSLDQASRPEKGLPLGPVVLPLPAQWPHRPAVGDYGDGTVLTYEWLDVDPAGWREAQDWTRSDRRRRRAAGDAIRALRATTTTC